jgi:hypothetical protein
MSSLSPEQVQTIKDWVAHYLGGPPRCGICSQATWDEWQIAAIGIKYSPKRSDGLHEAAITLTCQRCGQMVVFDPLVMQRTPQAEPPDLSLSA